MIGLSLRAWWLIFLDLSVDAVHPHFPAMGLARADDVAFAHELRALLEKRRAPFTSDEGIDEFVERVFELARSRGVDYENRLREWGSYIYPNHSALHTQIFRWRLVVARGGADGARDLRPAPQIIVRLRRIRQTFRPVQASDIHPVSAWDRWYCAERAEEGISCFEWVEAAVGNYRFLYAWEAATRGTRDPNRMREIYVWARGEAVALRLTQPPERCLHLPESLQRP
jgi:hypothetical protein